jgi:hypothetical protein
MGLTISLSRVSFLPHPVRNNIFYEIETPSTRLYNTGLGAQSTGGDRSPLWRRIFIWDEVPTVVEIAIFDSRSISLMD